MLAALCTRASDARATPPFAAAAAELPAPTRAALLGGSPASVDTLVLRADGTAVWTGMAPRDLLALRDDGGRVSAGALRVPQLDVATARVGATTVRAARGLSGRGVVVGVVDTGLDVRHPDVRNADGTTRVAWLLDLSRPPRGVHPELEARFGIARADGTRVGAVYSAADLDAMLAREAGGARVGELPVDEVGHGTYVASLAAGNGRAGAAAGASSPQYVGVAPAATLVIARATPEGSARFTDAAIVAGASFVVDRAAALAAPVVVNLSVGSQHGAHDGSAALERALAALVPPAAPGRAFVVAAGNDGAVAVHARADLLARAPAELPVLDVPAGASGAATDVVSLDIVYEGAASVAVRLPGGGETPWVAPGEGHGFGVDEGVVAIANATDGSDDALGEVPPSLSPRGLRPRIATVFFAGDPSRNLARRGGTYTVRLMGEGIAHAYVTDRGAAGTARFGPGVALADGTLAVPATAPALVAVGATVSRLRWPVGDMREFQACAQPASCNDPVLLAVAPFSARGPDRVNAPRPDLVAPGMYVVGALSGQAVAGAPASELRAETQRTADGAHFAAAGTSAAAPLVAGAMALLLEAQPDATQDALRAALAAGAHPTATAGGPRWNRDEGWGELDVPRALAVLEGAGAATTPDPAQSELAVARATLAPDEPTSVTLRLVGADGAPVRDDAVDPRSVVLRADGGRITAAPRALGGGRFEATFRASGLVPGSSAMLRATVAGVDLAHTATVRVAREVAPGAADGYAARGAGGCVATPRGATASLSRRAGVVLAVGALLVLARARRAALRAQRRRRRARRARR